MSDLPVHSALLLIDLQNDFLSPGGVFSKRHLDPAQLVQHLVWLADAARQQGRRVVWVTAIYGELKGSEDELKGLTHLGSPCCVRGGWGAEMVARAAAAVAPGDERVEKRWYSAFRETGLHERLWAAGVRRVVLGGVATNVCVLATAREARQLGYAVTVLSDGTTAASASRHASALREIEALGCQVRPWSDLLSDGPGPVQLGGLGAGDTSLWCNALGCVDATTFERIEREITWHRMMHRGGEVPRLVAIQGERGDDGSEPLYRHPVDGQPTLVAWTPGVDVIRRAVQSLTRHPLNHGLLQLYRDGRDWISDHSDKTLDLERPSFIVNVSLGHTRTMMLKPKDRPEEGGDEGGAAQRIPLPHGSCLLMGLGTNQKFYHSIRQQGASGADGPRISFTFRHIGSHWAPATGAVWGVGAPAATRAEAEARAAARAALPPDERDAAERAEAERLLRLFRDENVDPAFDARAYRPGFEVLDFRILQ